MDVRSNFGDVRAFHDKFGLAWPTAPQLLSPELLRFRLGFLIEELSEFAHAAGAPGIGQRLKGLALEARTCPVFASYGSLVDAFDSLLDLNVVSLGTAGFMGCPWEAGWDIVTERNLAKRRAKPDGSDSKRGSPFDVIKPAGWYGPERELLELLERHGYVSDALPKTGS